MGFEEKYINYLIELVKLERSKGIDMEEIENLSEYGYFSNDLDDEYFKETPENSSKENLSSLPFYITPSIDAPMKIYWKLNWKR